MPRFSVVIAVYNKESYLTKTIQSVLDQRFTDFEIIIVNDGSTDNSESIINSFTDSRIHYFSQSNSGVSATRNKAIEHATSDYIALLDADDLWDPNYLQTIHQLILSHPNQHVFATAVYIETKQQRIHSVYSVLDLLPNQVRVLDYFESSCINTLLTSSSTVLHKSVFEKIGCYNISIKSGQDTDLWIRIGLQYKIVFVNRVLVVYSYAMNSLYKSSKSISERATFDEYIPYEKENKALKKFLDLNRFSLAVFAKKNGDRVGYKNNLDKINLQNLNKKQIALLYCPRLLILGLIWIKAQANRFGIQISTYK